MTGEQPERNWEKNINRFFKKSCDSSKEFDSKLHTLYNVILRIARNFLETSENIKISTNPFYHINLDWFSWEWSKKNIFSWKKKFCFIHMKISPNLYGKMDGLKFWCFPWFPENSLLCVILHYTVYVIYELINSKYSVPARSLPVRTLLAPFQLTCCNV